MQDEYRARREALQTELQQPIVLTAHRQLQAKADMAYPFVQDSSFFYLTGITDPDWMLLWDTSAWSLVRPEVSEVHALFDGSLSGEDATKLSGITSVLDTKQYSEALAALAVTHKSIAALGNDPHEAYYDFSMNPAVEVLHSSLTELFSEVVDCRPVLRKMRATKTTIELEAQRRAIDVSVEAFAGVKAQLAELQHEYEIEAVLNKAFRSKGTDNHAYAPIVAAGKHACTLHYGKNESPLPTNGLVLIDAGTQFGGYVADITRTYAIGTPTERQIEIHAAVEKAHFAIMELIKPGVSFADYQASVDTIMKKALVEVGLLKDETDDVLYRTYFPHAIGHGLGLDVHESLGGYKTMQPGMVMTVEPGIYIPEEGIGVRIEDDILVTEAGYENLSKDLPTAL